MTKKLIALLLALAMCLSLTACGGDDKEADNKAPETQQIEDQEPDDDQEEEEPEETEEEEPQDTEGETEETEEETQAGNPDQTWAIYWYLCGSDLESKYGAASTDLQEMMQVTLPENVKVVIETGGAAAWQNEFADPSALDRFVYSSEGLNKVDSQPQANMGESETLESFLRFCNENYPADNTMVVFWNHGGGSVSGAAFDENFNSDSLTLSEMGAAFEGAFDTDENPNCVDIIGFDTCLMATVDTANTFSDVGKYLIASEELEPGGGWQYTAWLGAIAENPGIDLVSFSKNVCDSYKAGCEEMGVGDDITLSVTDLLKVNDLMSAYDAMGVEALKASVKDPNFIAALGRKAENSENYGGNTKEQGYTNMVDLGHLTQNCADILPEKSQAVLDALNACVLYKVNGPYRENAMGLSCYYPYNGNLDEVNAYGEFCYSDSFKCLYQYAIQGTMSEEGMEYVNSIGVEEEVQTVPDLENSGEEEYPITTDGKHATLTLNPDVLNMLKSVYIMPYFIDQENDMIYALGEDNNITGNWSEGTFTDNFQGKWASLDGHLVFLEVTYEGEEYTNYSIPILLNGEAYNLQVVYVYADAQYYIKGARMPVAESGMADRNLRQLQPGDEVTPILLGDQFSTEETNVKEIPQDAFKVTENTKVYDETLPNGTYAIMFNLVDAKNKDALSQMAKITLSDGEVTMTLS